MSCVYYDKSYSTFLTHTLGQICQKFSIPLQKLIRVYIGALLIVQSANVYKLKENVFMSLVIQEGAKL